MLWMRLIKSDRNSWRRTKSMNRLWATYLKNMMTKIIVKKPLWIWKNSSKKWSSNMMENIKKESLKVYKQWSSCKWPKRKKSKKIWMMPTSWSTNSKIRILNKSQLIVIQKSVRTTLSTERRALIIKTMKIKFREKYTGQTSLKA